MTHGNRGRPKSPEHRAKISASSMGKKMPPRSPATRAKMSAAGKRRPPPSAETRVKMSVASKAAWARRKHP